MRIALYGGSFDPVHNAHLQVAKTALKKGIADEVWMIPTYQNPWKTSSVASFSNRVKMLEAAISPYRKIKLCKIEEQLGGVSYTIDTVKGLIKQYPTYEFCYLIGSDQARTIEKWKAIDELMKLVKFYVFTREEEPIVSSYPLQFVEMKLLAISSTMVRDANLLYVPKSVRRVIGEQGSYLIHFVKTRMSEKRFLHSVSVANLAVEIAKCHGLDEKKAWLCGILHDICKEMPYQEAKKWLAIYHPEHLDKAPAIWHGYLGAHFVERYYYVYDKDVISAIYHHVLGNGTGVYDQLLYVCDKLDPLRPYDSSETIALCKKDLYKGFLMVKKQQHTYLLKEKVIA